MSKKKIVLRVSTAVALILLTFYFVRPMISSSVLMSRKAPGRGAIKAAGVNVYSDSRLRYTLTPIDWGVLEAGTGQNFTCYIKNLWDSPALLELATANWNPPTASQFLTLKWDYLGNPIAPNGVIKVTFTLMISPDITDITDLRFDIIVTGTLQDS